METEKQKYLYRGAKLYFASLNPDNMTTFFDTKYNQWLYYNSSEIAIDGNNIEPGWERFVNTLPLNKERNVLNKTAESSNTTKNGFNLTLDVFVDEELKKYNDLYIELEGNSRYRELRLKIKEYTNHLTKIKGNDYNQNILCLNTNLKQDNLNILFKSLISGGFIDSKTDKEFFYAAFNGTLIDKKFKPIVWLKNKQLLRELLFGYKPDITGISDPNKTHADIEKMIPFLFSDKKGSPMRLAKSNLKLDIYSDKIKAILATL